jgi:hypothetical protein
MSANYELTPEQEKAFASLERAILKCKAARVYLWDNYGTISAINGRKVNAITTNPRDGEPLDHSAVSTISVSARRGCWHGSNADDALFVER